MIATSPKTEAPKSAQPSVSDQDVILAAKGGGIAFAGNLSMYFIRFGFGVVMARLLGAELLGLYSLSETVIGIVSVLALLGLDAGLARYIPIAAGKKDEARLWGTMQTGIALSSLVSLVFAAGVFLLGGPLSSQVYDRPDLAPVLRLASLSVPIYALMATLTSITQGFKRMEYKVYTQDITYNLLKLILSAVLIWVGLSVMGAVIANIIAMAVTVAMLFTFVHRLFPLNRPLGTAKRDTGAMLRFTLPVYLSQVLRQFSGSIEALALGFFGVMSGVGIYTTALRLSGIGSMFHTSLQAIAIPMISDLHSRGRLEALRRVYQTTTKWGMTFNLPIFLTITIFAKPLLAIFGDDFVAGAAGVAILAFATLFNASTGVCGSMITMTGHSKLSFANSIIHLGVNITLDLLLIPLWGVMGAALAVTLTGMLINTLRVAQVFVLLRLWPYDRSFLKPLAASLIAAAATYGLNRWLPLRPVALQVAAGTLLLWSVYALVIVALRLSAEDRLVLDRLWARLGRLVG